MGKTTNIRGILLALALGFNILSISSIAERLEHVDKSKATSANKYKSEAKSENETVLDDCLPPNSDSANQLRTALHNFATLYTENEETGLAAETLLGAFDLIRNTLPHELFMPFITRATGLKTNNDAQEYIRSAAAVYNENRSLFYDLAFLYPKQWPSKKDMDERNRSISNSVQFFKPLGMRIDQLTDLRNSFDQAIKSTDLKTAAAIISTIVGSQQIRKPHQIKTTIDEINKDKHFKNHIAITNSFEAAIISGLKQAKSLAEKQEGKDKTMEPPSTQLERELMSAIKKYGEAGKNTFATLTKVIGISQAGIPYLKSVDKHLLETLNSQLSFEYFTGVSGKDGMVNFLSTAFNRMGNMAFPRYGSENNSSSATRPNSLTFADVLNVLATKDTVTNERDKYGRPIVDITKVELPQNNSETLPINCQISATPIQPSKVANQSDTPSDKSGKTRADKGSPTSKVERGTNNPNSYMEFGARFIKQTEKESIDYKTSEEKDTSSQPEQPITENQSPPSQNPEQIPPSESESHRHALGHPAHYKTPRRNHEHHIPTGTELPYDIELIAESTGVTKQTVKQEEPKTHASERSDSSHTNPTPTKRLPKTKLANTISPSSVNRPSYDNTPAIPTSAQSKLESPTFQDTPSSQQVETPSQTITKKQIAANSKVAQKQASPETFGPPTFTDKFFAPTAQSTIRTPASLQTNNNSIARPSGDTNNTNPAPISSALGTSIMNNPLVAKVAKSAEGYITQNTVRALQFGTDIVKSITEIETEYAASGIVLRISKTETHFGKDGITIQSKKRVDTWMDASGKPSKIVTTQFDPSTGQPTSVTSKLVGAQEEARA